MASKVKWKEIGKKTLGCFCLVTLLLQHLPPAQSFRWPSASLCRMGDTTKAKNTFVKRGMEDSVSWLFPQEQPNYISYLISYNSKRKLQRANGFHKAVSLFRWCWNNGRCHFITPPFVILTFCRKFTGHMALKEISLHSYLTFRDSLKQSCGGLKCELTG